MCIGGGPYFPSGSGAEHEQPRGVHAGETQLSAVWVSSCLLTPLLGLLTVLIAARCVGAPASCCLGAARGACLSLMVRPACGATLIRPLAPTRTMLMSSRSPTASSAAAARTAGARHRGCAGPKQCVLCGVPSSSSRCGALGLGHSRRDAGWSAAVVYAVALHWPLWDVFVCLCWLHQLVVVWACQQEAAVRRQCA